tara:strand:- start:309 stop:449 length:141 start_codon:yes stop_codon:yes gene_type:complete
MFTMARYRKYTSKKIIKLTRQQIMMIEDEWFDRYNRNYNANTKAIG